MEIDQIPENLDLMRSQPATPVATPALSDSDQQNQSRAVSRRAKSSLRLKYEAETHVIERKLGDLEAIRERLGLSQRKIAQLLLVDPSAWTRWTKGDDQAPPHIYRMLQWYLALEEKYPVLDVNFWLNTVAQMPDRNQKVQQKLIESEVDIQLRQKRLLEESKTQSKLDSLRNEFSLRESSLKRMILWMAITATLTGCIIGFVAGLFVR